MNFRSIIWFARLGLIPYILKTIIEENIPRCSACCFGQYIFTSTNTNGSGVSIEDEHGQPRMCISIYQIESPQSWLISVLKENQTSNKYHAATIFVDHLSKLTYVHFNEKTTANKAVEAKYAFEQYAATFGLNIKKFHADNGVFDTQVFKESIIAANQTIVFSAGDSHKQNRIAEHIINTVTYRAWIMLFKYNDLLDTCYHNWILVYAIKLAIDVVNNCPDKSSLTALYRFSSKKCMLEWNNVIYLDHLASSLTPNFTKRNLFQNGHLYQDKSFIFLYFCSMQEVSHWFWIKKMYIFLHNSIPFLMMILQQQPQG